MFACSEMSRRLSVVLPVPDGADTTYTTGLVIQLPKFVVTLYFVPAGGSVQWFVSFQ